MSSLSSFGIHNRIERFSVGKIWFDKFDDKLRRETPLVIIKVTAPHAHALSLSPHALSLSPHALSLSLSPQEDAGK
jgi:hypothetical protein